MLSLASLDQLQATFDDDRLVADAGLLLPATLAQHLGLQELADSYLDLGDAPGRANAGDKLLTLVASALAGGDCIADADAMRAGDAGRVLGCTVKAPSTLGTFLRSFRWGHVRQLDRVSRELLARSWAAGAGPGDAPFTIDLDSTICETYGLAKTPQDAKGSSSEVRVVGTVIPGGGLVVAGAGPETAVQVADESVGEGAQRLVVEVAGGAPCVVEVAAARARPQRAQRPLVGGVVESPVADEARLHGPLAAGCYGQRRGTGVVPAGERQANW